MRIAAMLLLLVGLAGFAMANVVIVPEIDANSAAAALALLSSAGLLIRGRRAK